MKITVKDFGPISNAELDVARINVIVGRNNIGKSFLAQLVFAIVSSLVPRRRHYPVWDAADDLYIEGPSLWTYPQIFLREQEFRKSLKSLQAGKLTKAGLLTKILDVYLKGLATNLDSVLPYYLERTFSVPLKELVKFNADVATVSVRLSPYNTFSFSINNDGSIAMKLNVAKEELVNKLLTRKRATEYVNRMAANQKLRHSTLENYFRIERMFEVELLGHYIYGAPYYMPAGRAGLLEGWETISTAWVNLAPISISRGITMPPLPGTAAMFYTLLHSLSGKRRGKFYSTRTNFVEILGGELEMSQQIEMRGKKDIYYKSDRDTGFKTNIIHAGSMIKEIGPLYLVIREVLDNHDFFIVEEPESHLHPTAQRDLINIMIAMAMGGVQLLLTTHSDILLRTLAHKVAEESRESPKRISMKDLSIYLLNDTPEGSVSNRIDTSKSGAIEDLPTFDEVMKELYDDELRLEILKND